MPRPPYSWRDGRAEQAERLHLLDHRGRIDVAVLQLQDTGPNVAIQPFPDRIQDLRLVILG